MAALDRSKKRARCIACVALILTAPGCGNFGGQRLLHTPDFGSAIAVVGDRNGDGVREIAVGDPTAGGRMSAFGAVALYDGRTLAGEKVLRGVRPDAFFGAYVDTLRDVDLDGIDDFAVASWQTDPASGSRVKHVDVISTRTLQPLLAADEGDQDQDSSASTGARPQVRRSSLPGATGADRTAKDMLQTWTVPHGPDTTACVVADPSKAEGWFFRLHVEGDERARWSIGWPELGDVRGRIVRLECCACGDLDGDRVEDLVLALCDEAYPSLPSRLTAVSGASGATVWTTTVAKRGMLCLAGWDDRNGDGARECLVGITQFWDPDSRGRVLVIDGATGQVVDEID
jgi:hypothetical protein